MDRINQLKSLIARAEAELIYHKSEGNKADDLGLLFTGNWHDSIPRNIILHQSLQPVEKLTWQALRLTIHQPQQPGSTPTRDELALMVNCSAPTISNARQMLRLMRYTTLCSVVRKGGKFMGEIHLLHDEPMDIGTTIELDPSYIEFVETLSRSGNKASRVRKEAALILQQLHKLNVVPKPLTTAERMAERVTRSQSMPGAENLTQEASAVTTSMLHPQEKPSHQRKNLSLDHFSTSHQRKNFTLDDFLTDNSIFNEFDAISVDSHQRKNLSPVDFLINSHQSKNLSPVVCSNSSSSNIYKYIFNTRVRVDDEVKNFADRGDQKSSNLAKADQTTPKITNDFAVDRYPEIDSSGEIARFAERFSATKSQQTQNLDWTHNPDEDPLATYPEVDFEIDDRELSEFESLITRFLPEIANPNLSRYVETLFLSIRSQIPFVAHVVKALPEQHRANVLFQALARHAAHLHGWVDDPIANPVGFIKSLVNKLRNGEFTPDAFAIELKLAVKENRKPAITDSANMIAKRKRDEAFFGQKLATKEEWN